MNIANAFLPQDRLAAFANNRELPQETVGSVLFADISGFTPLADALAKLHGSRRGADELTRHLNEVYNALIHEVERFGGSVIGFAGDAITCWFGEAGDASDNPQLLSAQRAVAAALAMQQAIQPVARVQVSTTTSVQLVVKTAVASGKVHRFVVGDPAIQRIDVLAGDTLDRMAAAEHLARTGELLVDQATVAALGARLSIAEQRHDAEGRGCFAVVEALFDLPIGTQASATLPQPHEELVRSWVIPTLFARLQDQSSFLAELRPATSLFLRFSGLDFEQDPEAGNKLDQFICYVQQVISRHEATLIQLTTGDKGSYLYAAFGAPIAHDDDSRRAVVAALDLRNSSNKFPFLSTIQIGISQGSMRVGPYGSDTRQTYGVLGEEVNLAARLMTNARAGQILVSKAIYEATIEDFLFDEPLQLRVKGRAEVQTVYNVIGRQARIASHLQRLYEEPLAAREKELSQMQQTLEQVLTGPGRMLRIEGSAGVGKSHLVATFLKRTETKGVNTTAAICQSTERDTAYHATRQITRSLFGLHSQMSESIMLDRIEEVVRNTNPTLLLRLPLLGEIIGIEIPDNPTTASLDPKLRQEALQSLAVELLQANARRTPLVLLVEDVHWMDEASQALLLALARVIDAAPILLLVVHRPVDQRQEDKETERQEEPGLSIVAGGEQGSFLTDLAQLANQDFIRLEELPPSGTIQLVTQRLKGNVSPLAVALIQAQAQGNPFFTEELVDALYESGRLVETEGEWTLSEETIAALQAANCLVRSGESWQLRPDAPLSAVDLGMPNSIQGVILSRLDRLPESVKPTLKVASVIGRLFEFDLLAQAHPSQSERTTLTHDMATLLERDFARVEQPEPALAYIFKHNITQEVAYSTLLENQRRQLHHAVGLALERMQPEAIERLAFHFYNSDLAQLPVRDKAIQYLDRAAQRAQRDYANETALSYLNRALQLEQRRQWLKAKVEVLDILGRREQQEEALHQLTALAGEDFETLLLWGKYFESVSDYEQATTIIGQALTVAQHLDNSENKPRCLNQLGVIAWRQGEYEIAGEKYIAALSEVAIWGMVGTGVEAEAHYGLGLVYRQQGKYEEAKAEFARALRINQKIHNKQQEARALNAVGSVERHRRNFQAAIPYHEQALAICEIIGDRTGVGASLLNIAQSLGELGDHDQAKPLLLRAISIQQSIGNLWWEATTWNDLGVLYLLVGDLHAAKESLENGLHLSQKIGQKNAEAYLLCNLGQVLRDIEETDRAESLLVESLELAQIQGDIQLEAICLNDLALLDLQRQEFQESVAKAQRSIAKYHAIGLESSTTSDLTILASAYLALHDDSEALGYATEAMRLLDIYREDNLNFPQRDYWFCFQVFQALHKPEQAIQALNFAVRLLQEQALKISNGDMRRSFIENVPYHREILQAAQTDFSII
ncbi:MAG: tetratricopeptide repeat protein [Caldilineaceae bacterium]